MAKKEFKGPGKGNGPVVGYNYKNWYSNYDDINWGRKVVIKELGNITKELLSRSIPANLKIPVKKL